MKGVPGVMVLLSHVSLVSGLGTLIPCRTMLSVQIMKLNSTDPQTDSVHTIAIRCGRSLQRMRNCLLGHCFFAPCKVVASGSPHTMPPSCFMPKSSRGKQLTQIPAWQNLPSVLPPPWPSAQHPGLL